MVLTFLGDHRKTLKAEKKSSLNLSNSYGLSPDLLSTLTILLLQDLLRLLP